MSANISGGRSKIAEAIQQAYCIVVTVSEKNEIQAVKIPVEGPSLFACIKGDRDNRARIQDTAISADALLPEGPYNLWHTRETSRRLKDLVGAFALSPQLPKMLNRRAILGKLVLGCREDQFVLSVARPDRSIRTFWRQEPDEAALKDPSLEVVLPEAAELAELPSDLLTPGRVPNLWKNASASFGDPCNYFSGGFVAKIDKGGYEEPLTVPKASREALARAVQRRPTR